MIPFLKEDSIAQSSNENEDYGTLDAVAEDLLTALHKKDRSLIKQALESLCEYLKEEDTQQDQSLINKE